MQASERPWAGTGSVRGASGTTLGEKHAGVMVTRALSCFLPPTETTAGGAVTWRGRKTLRCEQSRTTLLKPAAGASAHTLTAREAQPAAGRPGHTRKAGRCTAVPFSPQKKPFIVASCSHFRRSECHLHRVYEVINDGQGKLFRCKTKSHQVYFCVPQFPYHERMGPRHLPIQGQVNSRWKPLQVRCFNIF